MSAALDQLTLDQLALTKPSRGESVAAVQQPSRQLDLVPVKYQYDDKHSDWNSDAFEALVSSTYLDTLDCPALSEYRSASQHFGRTKMSIPTTQSDGTLSCPRTIVPILSAASSWPLIAATTRTKTAM